MSMLSVPVVRVICFLSGLKNIALKCLHSADYFSVFLCHRNSSALVGKTALVLSAETCFYNQQGSCVVLAGLCGARSGEDTVRGSSELWAGSAVAAGGAESLATDGQCRVSGKSGI